MEIERADIGFKRCKYNEAKIMNLQSLTGIRNGIENGDIPDWLLVEVLVRLRLSAKLVCRFKLISKQWLSIISDPSFVARVFRASLLSRPWTFISHLMHYEGYKDSRFPEYMLLDDVYELVKPSYCVLPLPCTQQLHNGEKYLIDGVSNGLVLYSLTVNLMHNYYICNPVTRLWFALPTLTCQSLAEGCGFLTQVKDGVLKSYTVVRLEMLTGRSNDLSFKLFFSEIGEWKNYKVFSALEVCLPLRRQATSVNGVLHWIASDGIIAYDPYQSPEQVRIITFPMNRQGKDPYRCLCAEYIGKLRYFEKSIGYISQKRSASFTIWVLNDHISGGWSLQHKNIYKDIPCDPYQPLSFHPFDLDVVYLGWSNGLVSYNIKTKELEAQRKFWRQNEITPKRSPDWWWAFSLVIPSWPVCIRRFSSEVQRVD